MKCIYCGFDVGAGLRCCGVSYHLNGTYQIPPENYLRKLPGYANPNPSMTLTDAINRLSTHAPLGKMTHAGEPIISNRDRWPFALNTREEMEALVTLVNRVCLSPVTITMKAGNPPECGNYLVTDGEEELGIDSWLEYAGDRARLPSEVGTPSDKPITRRWGRYQNVKAWCSLFLSKEK